jgi:hypothetical protein
MIEGNHYSPPTEAAARTETNFTQLGQNIMAAPAEFRQSLSEILQYKMVADVPQSRREK